MDNRELRAVKEREVLGKKALEEMLSKYHKLLVLKMYNTTANIDL